MSAGTNFFSVSFFLIFIDMSTCLITKRHGRLAIVRTVDMNNMRVRNTVGQYSDLMVISWSNVVLLAMSKVVHVLFDMSNVEFSDMSNGDL